MQLESSRRARVDFGIERPNVVEAYDASAVTFRVLRAFGWGPLLNLGYYPFGPPLSLLNFVITPLSIAPMFRLPAAQLKLVRKSVRLLGLGTGSRVLDIACGRGMSSYVMASQFPHLQVTAIDLLHQSLGVARTLYSNTANLEYLEGDAMNLAFPAGSFDRALCLEAAFHFPDRRRFLEQLFDVLEPGGRAVIVDFTWRDDTDERVWKDARTDIVRRVWQWTNFDTYSVYLENARRSGFEVESSHDWSGHVTAPLRAILRVFSWLAQSAGGRWLLRRYNPLLEVLAPHDWDDFVHEARAHQFVQHRTRYAALVLRRGSNGAGR